MRKPILLVCAVLVCGLLSACGTLAPAREGLWEELGLAPDQTVASADDREISAGLYLYWLTEITDGIRQYYSEEEQEPDWSKEVEEGLTLGQYAKERALESAALYAAVENWAQRYDCALTEADRAEAARAWDDTAAEQGGEDAYLAALAQKGLDEAGGRRMAEDHILYQKLCALAMEEGSGLWEEPADLDLFYTQRGYVTVDLVEVAAGGAEEAAALFGHYKDVDIIITHAFFPVVAAHVKADQDQIPLFGWQEDGWLDMTNDKVTNHHDVVQWYKKLRADGFKIRRIGHDRKFCREYFVEMQKERFPIKDQPQLFTRKSEGFRYLEASAKKGTLYYMHAEPYEYCVQNVAGIEKADDMVMYQKIEPNLRIDLFDASVFAVCAYLEDLTASNKAAGWYDKKDKDGDAD